MGNNSSSFFDSNADMDIFWRKKKDKCITFSISKSNSSKKDVKKELIYLLYSYTLKYVKLMICIESCKYLKCELKKKIILLRMYLLNNFRGYESGSGDNDNMKMDV